MFAFMLTPKWNIENNEIVFSFLSKILIPLHSQILVDSLLLGGKKNEIQAL